MQISRPKIPGAGGAVLRERGAPGPEDFGLPIAEEPDFLPTLQITDDSIDQILAEKGQPGTLFVTDDYNFERAKTHGPTYLCTTHSDPREVALVRDLRGFPSTHTVIGVGGCNALDMAKAIGADRSVEVVPTILSTNCVAKNRSVLGVGLGSFSYRTQTPSQVTVSLTELEGHKPWVKARWSQAGWGDYFAKVGALIDQEHREGGVATREVIRTHDAGVADSLDWVIRDFRGYNRDSAIKLAECVHDAGVRVTGARSNDNSVGGEHKFYKALLDHRPDLRTGAPHGTIVGVGTLIAAAAQAEMSGQGEVYDQLRQAFSRLGIPRNYLQCNELGLERDDMLTSLRTLSRLEKPTVLGDYFAANPNGELLDRVFRL